MKTVELIDMLARQLGPAPRRLVQARLGTALAVGLVASVVMTAAVLGLNPALANISAPYAVKMAYAVGLMLGAAWLAARLARPGARFRRPLTAIVAVVAAMGVLCLFALLDVSASTRLEFLIGRSWLACPWRVAALSVPAFVSAIWALRGLAPTRPRLAGFAAGLLAGSIGAVGYALSCPELSPLFVLVWYSLGILVPAFVGAIVGPRLLRW